MAIELPLMTAVSTLRVDFREIGDFRITCENCKTEIAIPLEQQIPKYLDCPGCNKHFWGNGQGKGYQHAQNISASLRNWRSADHAEFSLGFTLPHLKEVA